jgi:putative ATP-binding cassette transporter
MPDRNNHNDNHLLARFWRSACGFWCGRAAWRSWPLTVLLIVVVIGELFAEYWLNYWNRDFFNALEARDALALQRQALLFLPLAGLSIGLALISVWARMTMQRMWRQYLTTHLINYWLTNGHYRHIHELNGGSGAPNPEYRVAEDARVATDSPIDLALALLSSVLITFTFLGILRSVGGDLRTSVLGFYIFIPDYLVVGVIVYSGLVTSAMIVLGRRLADVVQDHAQAEAEFRAAANRVRESGEGMNVGNESEETRALWQGLHDAIEQWRRLCWQLMRTTLVSQGNTLLAPIVGLLLCIPKYLDGALTLGEVTQAAAAFVTLQGAINWVVNNFQRLADWRAAARRVATLLIAIDDLQQSNRTLRPDSLPCSALHSITSLPVRPD